MAKTAIRLFFNNGNTETIKHIDCGSSSPYLKGNIRLNTFTGLTAFDGGDNDLETVTGFSQLTSLKRFEIAGANTVSFDISSLPVNLEYFNLRGSNTTSGSISALPPSLTYYNNTGSNTTSGDIGMLPASLRSFSNRGLNTTTGNLSTLPSDLNLYDNRGNNTVYSYYDGESLGSYRQRIWADPQNIWSLEPALSSGVPGMPDTHLATLLVDLSGVTWTGNRSFTADVNNPTLSSNQPYWSKVQDAINAIRSQGVTVAVLTAQV